MRRTLPLLALLTALLLLPATFADAGPSKSFDQFGFKWSLPDEWTFVPVSPQDVQGGYVAKAECQAASIEAWLYTAGTEDLGLDGRVKDIVDNGAGGLGTVLKAGVGNSTLSGVQGKVVIQRIKADGGAMGHFRTYVIVSGGKFYQLIVRAWHDAHTSQVDGINAMRAGFRLLKGAGGEDKPETMTELGVAKEGGGDGAGGGDEGSGGGEGGGPAGADAWPPAGPRKEGTKVFLPEHNLEWNLSSKSHFRWTDAPTPVKEKQGRFLVARAKVERIAKEEFQKNRPASEGFIDLIVQEIPPGLKVENWYTSGSAKDNVEKWKMFDEFDTPNCKKLNTDKVGNITGANMKFEGKKNGRRHVLFIATATLRDKWYVFRAYMAGANDVWKHMRNNVGRAMSGVKFLETSELTRGPLLGAIPDFAWHRGEHADKEREYKGPGYSFKKPKGMAYVKVRDSMNRDIRFTGEMRNKEGDAYLYFEIRTFKMNIPNVPAPKPEKFVNDRAEDWSAGGGESADVGNKKGELGKKGRFGRAKGLTYEFTGDLEGVPYMEEGYVVKHKGTLLWIKLQYGGVDAEKKLSKEAKKVKKGVKFIK